MSASEGRSTAHAFSFGTHYDPRNLCFGPLVAHNDERLAPGAGYAPHEHRDVDIVTWVLSGELRHTDNLGNSAVVRPGQVQVLRAGSGVTHAEVAADTARAESTRFIQSWLRPDICGSAPTYEVRTAHVGQEWTEVVGQTTATVGVANAALFIARPDEPLCLPDAPSLYLFCTVGTAMIGEREIRPATAVKLTGEGRRTITPTDAATEIMVWAFGMAPANRPGMTAYADTNQRMQR